MKIYFRNLDLELAAPNVPDLCMSACVLQFLHPAVISRCSLPWLLWLCFKDVCSCFSKPLISHFWVTESHQMFWGSSPCFPIAVVLKEKAQLFITSSTRGCCNFLFNNDEMKLLLQINYFIKGSNVQESSDYKSKLIS